MTRGLLPLGLLAGLACGGVPLAASYPITTPPEAVVPLELPTLQGLVAEERALWERHLRSSLKWEIRHERGCTFAVRLEPQERGGAVVYESTLNGFYSDFDAEDGVYQTRVVMGLGCEHGFGVDRGQITYADSHQAEVQLKLEDYMDQPGLNSKLLVRGGAGVSVEVFEQGDPEDRPFTRAALAEVEAELRAVLASREELEREGVIPALVPPGSTTTGAPSLVVEDGMQPGIYLLTAWVNPGGEGEVHARVFFEGAAPGHPPPDAVGAPSSELSAALLRPRSTRQVGWGLAPDRLFRYQSEVTVYEGEWGEPYLGRFELWFVEPSGAERELVQTTRQIEGWSR